MDKTAKMEDEIEKSNEEMVTPHPPSLRSSSIAFFWPDFISEFGATHLLGTPPRSH